MSSTITVQLQCSEEEREVIRKAFRNGCGRRRMNINATDEQIAEWQENGWIERRADQPIPYYELKV